jgi:expansin (peptidoglycan-binding protein)
VTATGTGFTAGCVVESPSGTPLATTYVSPTQLTFGYVTTAGSVAGPVNVVVRGPGGVSSSVQLTLT